MAEGGALQAASVSQGPLTAILLLIVPLQDLDQGMYEVGPTGQRGWLRFGVFSNAGCHSASVELVRRETSWNLLASLEGDHNS